MKAPKKAKKAKTPAAASPKTAVAKKLAATKAVARKVAAKKIVAPKKVAAPKKAVAKKPTPKKVAKARPKTSGGVAPVIRLSAKPAGPVVADVLAKRHRQLISVKTKVPLTTAANLFARQSLSLAVVVDDEGKFNGVLSERDLVKSLAAFGARAAQMTVGEVNTRKVKACALETPLDLVLQTMRDGGFHHMPVVTNGRIEGIVGAVDVLAHLAGKSDAIIAPENPPPAGAAPPKA
jgi:CBS domain-containing protein